MQQVLSTTYRSSTLSAWNLGTTGQTLAESMNSNRRGIGSKTFKMSEGNDVNDVIAHLKQGRPVVAMIGTQASKRVVGGGIGQVIDKIGGSGSTAS